MIVQVLVLSTSGIYIGSKTRVIVFPGWHFKIVSMVLTFRERLVDSTKYEVCCVVLVSLWNILAESCCFSKKKLLWFNDL